MKCDSPYYVLPKAGIEKVPVPCGKCPACKHRRVNDWVFRMLEEQKVSSSSYFVTLTYDTRFVPITDNGFMTLRKKDYQDFMKRLRNLCPDFKLKYYAVGEYGSKTNRPHYHAIVFNVPDTSMFSDAWNLGTVHVGQVSSDSIAYTMKYIDKSNFARRHARDDREKEFPLMSKGLGSNYLTPAMVKYHQADFTRLYATKVGGYRISLPRYYRNKIYDERTQKMQARYIQNVVNVQEAKLRLDFDRLGYTDVNYYDYIDSKRFGRYERFYQKQSNRNL